MLAVCINNLYKGVADTIHVDDRDADNRDAGNIGQNVGYVMIIVSHFEKPDLFVTFICNSKWQEITRKLLPYQDRPDLMAHVFHIKLQELLKDLCEKHCLNSKLHSAEDYNAIVSVEIPDPNVHCDRYIVYDA
ncbi:unnamed protein product [Rhizophagus irregularis]|nr:unnamed protein product [Rhizophagus irregularis]